MGLRGPKERPIARTSTADGGAVVASREHLTLLDPGGAPLWQRPWHEVEAGAWSSDDGTLTVSWADGSPALRIVLDQEHLERRLLQAFRERVQASVVLVEELVLPAPLTGRVVIRQDLSTRELFDQVVLSRPALANRRDVVAEVDRARARLHEQVGD